MSGTTAQRLSGVTAFSINGNYYEFMEGSYSLSNVQRDNVGSMSRPSAGYSEKPIPGTINATILDNGSLDTAAFNAMVNVTVEIQLANGKTILGTGMFQVGEALDVKVAEQPTFELKFTGGTVQSLLAS